LEKKKVSMKNKKNRPWDKYVEKITAPPSFVDEVPKNYINDEGFEVPENTLMYYNTGNPKFKISDIIESLIGHQNRDWFSVTAFSFCLPLTIANQYGFVVKSNWDMELFWDGDPNNQIVVKSDGWQNHESIQPMLGDFFNGILTFENKFVVRTPPGINLMTMQPPNSFIRGIHVMQGVVESDNLRRNFTFNLKITEPNTTINIKKGDWIAAFIPIPRFFVDNFKLKDGQTFFGSDIIENEMSSIEKLGWERHNSDSSKTNGSGRRYFKGIHVNETSYKDHQKRVTGNDK
jgi:hypothetical protein